VKGEWDMDKTIRPSSNNGKDEGFLFFVAGVRPITGNSESSSDNGNTETNKSASDSPALRVLSTAYMA
jgi:hypothetical protein